ncbi:MAG: energy transducer TonB [Nibricoccus sp.]
MNRKYALPAALALAVHALIFFVGSGKPPPAGTVAITSTPKDSPKPPEKDIFDRVVQVVNEEVKNIADNKESGGETTEEVLHPPGIPELPPTDYGIDDGRMRQTYDPVPIGPGDKIPGKLRGWGDGGGSGSGNGIFNPTSLDAPPATRYQKEPVYPAALRSSGATGTVWVEFIVMENGRVQNVKVIKSTHRGFDDATVAAVSEWRFVPGKHKGLPVRFRMSLPVVFSLSE